CTHPLPAYPHPPPPLSPTPALHDALPILGRVLRRSGRPDRHLRPRGRERLALEPLATTGSMPCPTRPPASTPRAPCLSRAAAPRAACPPCAARRGSTVPPNTPASGGPSPPCAPPPP